jgi:hypothetical protein
VTKRKGKIGGSWTGSIRKKLRKIGKQANELKRLICRAKSSFWY